MAKKGPKQTGRWQAVPDDAIRLAALRWFALQLESVAICNYATDAATYLEMEDILKHALRKMQKVTRKQALSDDECPEGFVRCKDGTCAPACDGIIAAFPDRK